MRLKVRREGFFRGDRFLALVTLVMAVSIGLATSSERSAAQDSPQAMVFLVDTSRSMTGEPLAQAKSALLRGTSAIPVGALVGLRSYSGPCDDPGLERVQVGPFDKPTFDSAVEAIDIGEPGTPTPTALRAAAATLPENGDRTLVLISDGRSDCSDPCPVARELAERLGPGFRIDTVGFRIASSAEDELDCIARVARGTYVSVNDSAGLQRAIARSTAATVTTLRLSRKTFAAAAKGRSLVRVARARVGTRVLYTVSESVGVRFSFERAVPGTLGRNIEEGECRKPTSPTVERSRRCTRYVKLRGSFVHAGKKGLNRIKFTGRLRGKKLRPGRYRLVATATDAAGNTANPKRAKFKIVER